MSLIGVLAVLIVGDESVRNEAFAVVVRELFSVKS